MKKVIIHSRRIHLFKLMMSTGLLLFAFTRCEIQPNFEYEYSNSTGELGVTAWEFIQQQDSLSLMEEAVMATGLENLYSGSEQKTFIVPKNSAFRDYLKTNHFSSINDIPVPILKNILLYHVVEGKILFSDEDFYISNSPLPYQTENGQKMYLSRNTNYQGLINQGTNQSWTIVTSNLEPTNGAIDISPAIVYFSAVTGSTDVPDVSLASDTIFATQDAYVRAGTYVDANFGAADDLTLRSDNGSGVNDRKVFLMFDLSELSASGLLREAYLDMGAYYAAGKGANINLYNVQDITWSENSITWNTMPAHDADVFSSTVSTPITYLNFGTFNWNITNYVSSKIASPGKVSILIDAELNTNDGIMFVSKENSTYSYPAKLIAVYSAGNSMLTMGTNTGLTVANQGSVVLSNTNLQMEGAAPADIIYTLVTAPENGWLVMGSQILTSGSKFSQLDIDVNNIVYVHSGAGTSKDSFSVSVQDKDGGLIDAFDVTISVQ